MLRGKKGKSIARGGNTKGKEMPKFRRNSQKNDHETSPLEKQLREEKRKNSKLEVNYNMKCPGNLGG